MYQWMRLSALPLLILGIVLSGCDRADSPVTSTDSSSLGTLPVFTMIPEGATLDSATFFIFNENISGRTIELHRITADWVEMEVTWNSFAESYAPDVISTFTGTGDWVSADVTSLVEDWMEGTYPNFGIVLRQETGMTPRTHFTSRDALANHPYLHLCYTTDAGSECEDLVAIADAHVWELYPDMNVGAASRLSVGLETPSDLEKIALVRFEIPETPPEEEGCTRTIGYWKNHAGQGKGNQADEVTPLLPIWLGDAGGEKSLLVDSAEMAYDVLVMKTYGHEDNGITKLYAQLLGAKLNIASGAGDDDVAEIIAEADAFLAEFDWTDWEGMDEETQQEILDWQTWLDDYNNGDIGPGHCDEDEEGEEEGD